MTIGTIVTIFGLGFMAGGLFYAFLQWYSDRKAKAEKKEQRHLKYLESKARKQILAEDLQKAKDVINAEFGGKE
jgi:Flp pilus assembly protein TadB